MNAAQAGTRYRCSHVAPQSCPWCDGSLQDEAERRRDARQQLAAKQQRVRRDWHARQQWLATFPPEERAAIAADADRRWGVLAPPLREAS